MPDRKQLGQQKLGEPVWDAFGAIAETVDQNPWPDFNREAVRYYFDKMVGAWLLRLIDNSLSDAQLAAVDPVEVKILIVSLFRDMFRHNHDLLRPSIQDGQWVETLFGDVAKRLHLPADRLADGGQPYEIDEVSQCDWARELGKPFGVPAEKLFVCHSAIVTGVREEADQ
jgi:hypothetical protein